MNQVTICAQTTEVPREVPVSVNSTVLRCNLLIPPVGNKAPTPIEYNIYGKAGERFRNLPKDSKICIHNAKLRFDLETRTHTLHGGNIAVVDETFPIWNSVTLAGRCVKDIQQDDARAFKTTADGLMICNQTLSVNTGRNQADLFNFYAINSHQDKLNNAQLLVDFTRKGTGLTITGRLVTDAWQDKETKERKHNTKIQLVSMTLAPKAGHDQGQSIRSQTVVANAGNVAPLWGGRTADDASDPWTVASGGGLPDLPGQYGAAPDLDEVPF